MNRRGLFKGLGGATVGGPEVARSVISKGSGYPSPPQIPMDNLMPMVEKAFAEPLDLAKQAFRIHCREQENILRNQINNQIYAIKRQKSTSEAYKDYMIAKLEEQRDSVWQRAEELVRNSW